MGNNTNKKIASGLGWTYGERLLAQIVSLAVSTVLARILDPDHYGVISIVMVFITILDTLAISGFGTALVQKKDADALDFNTICCLSVAMSVILYVILFFVAPYIAAFYRMEQLTAVTRVMGIRVLISAFNSVQQAYVQKKMEFQRFFYATLGGALLSAVVGIAMAYMGAGVWALVAQSITNAAVGAIVLSVMISWKPRLQFSFSRLKTMLLFGLQTLCASLVNTLQDNIRSLVIAKVFTATDLAYYDQGKKYPATLMNNLVGSVQRVMLPAFSAQSSLEEQKQLMRSAIRLSSFVLVPAVIGVISVADTFVILLLTEKWAMAIPYMRILSIIYITRTMNTLFQSNLLALGKSDLNMYHEILGSVLSVVMICIGALVLKSVQFIAWSSVIVMIVGTLFYIWCVRRYVGYRIREILADYLPYLCAAAIMGIVVYLVGRLAINKFLLLMIQILVGVLVYGCASKVMRIKEWDKCVELVKQYAGKLKRR